MRVVNQYVAGSSRYKEHLADSVLPVLMCDECNVQLAAHHEQYVRVLALQKVQIQLG